MSSETPVQQQCRLQLPFIAPGSQIWRNQSGAMIDQNGRLVRFGLCNDSAQLNRRFKSSDLIGVTPTLITQAMVGYHLGVFTALEAKPPGWHLTPGDDRGHAQAAYHGLVRDACGFAGFVTSVDDMRRIIGR